MQWITDICIVITTTPLIEKNKTNEQYVFFTSRHR